MKLISYIPTSTYSKNIGYDKRNIILYSKIKKIKIYNFNHKNKYDYLILPPTFDISNLGWLRKRNEKIIYQLVDDYLSENNYSIKNYLRGFYKYLKGENKYIIYNYKEQLKKICKISDIIICSSNKQKQEIKKYNKNVYILFEGNFNTLKVVKNNFKIKKNFKIVWEGRCENLKSLNTFYPVFKKLIKKYNIELHILTDFEINKFFSIIKYDSIKQIKKIFKNSFSANTTFKDSKIFIHQWNLTFSKIIIANSDLAIIPLMRNFNFDKGKGKNKLLMFMRLKIPILTSRNDSYNNIFKKIKVDGICNTSSEWLKKLEKLINSETLRKKYATTGYNYVNKYYGKKQFISQWDNLFKL